MPINTVFQISPVEIGFLSYEPGLMVTNSIAKVHQNRFIPVMIVKNTNKTFTIRKGCPVAKIGQAIMSVNAASMHKASNETLDLFDEVDASTKLKGKIIKLLRNNADLFTQKDSELSHTDTVKMKIKTGDHPPIKLRPYRTPLRERPLCDR